MIPLPLPLRRQHIPGRRDRDGRPRRDVCRRGQGERGKRFDRQGGRAGRTGENEAVREAVNLVRIERGVEGGGKRLLAQSGADVGAVPGFYGENRARGGQVGGAYDVGGGAEVGGYADSWGRGRWSVR